MAIHSRYERNDERLLRTLQVSLPPRYGKEPDVAIDIPPREVVPVDWTEDIRLKKVVHMLEVLGNCHHARIRDAHSCFEEKVHQWMAL